MYVAQERREYILRILQQRGSVRSADLAQELEVTDETIRTDLVALQAKKLLKRVHGGAVYILPVPETADNSSRTDVRMADLVLPYIENGMRLYLDNDPLLLALVSRLTQKTCRLLTPAPEMVSRLMAHALPHTIECTGGTLDKESGLFLCEENKEFLLSHPPDLAILSPQAVRAKAAAFDHYQRANWAAAATKIAINTIVMVPESSLTNIARHTIEIDPLVIITEDNIPQHGFIHAPIQTVPYIPREAVIPNNDF